MNRRDKSKTKASGRKSNTNITVSSKATGKADAFKSREVATEDCDKPANKGKQAARSEGGKAVDDLGGGKRQKGAGEDGRQKSDRIDSFTKE